MVVAAEHPQAQPAAVLEEQEQLWEVVNVDSAVVVVQLLALEHSSSPESLDQRWQRRNWERQKS